MFSLTIESGWSKTPFHWMWICCECTESVKWVGLKTGDRNYMGLSAGRIYGGNYMADKIQNAYESSKNIYDDVLTQRNFFSKM